MEVSDMSVLTIPEMQVESGLSRPTLYRFLKEFGLEATGSALGPAKRFRDGVEETITCPFKVYDAEEFRDKVAEFKNERTTMISPPGFIMPRAAAEKYARFGVTKSVLQQWEKDCPGRENALQIEFEDAVVIIQRGGKKIRQHWELAKHYHLSQVKEAVKAWRKLPRVRGEAKKLHRRGKDSARMPRKCRALTSVKSKAGELFQQIQPGVVKDKDGGIWAGQTAAFVDDHVNDQALRAWASKGWVDTVQIERVGFGRFPYSTYYRQNEPRGYLAIKALQAGKNRNVPAEAAEKMRKDLEAKEQKALNGKSPKGNRRGPDKADETEALEDFCKVEMDKSGSSSKQIAKLVRTKFRRRHFTGGMVREYARRARNRPKS
jgi:hypothetical protein